MGFIECKALSVRFDQWEGVFSCNFQEGEWHVICGNSGSGKSTFFQLMLGLLTPISGDILVDGASIADRAPHQRHMTFMAQYNLLLPHLSIEENLRIALHDSHFSNPEKSSQINEVLSLLKLEKKHLNRKPEELSGGQLSRCNLARALLRPARWILLDEPFSAVDRPTRLSILEWIKHWQGRTGAGVLLASHDLDDIFNVASNVTVLSCGRVLESQLLDHAIRKPLHKTTASMLRSGVIITRNQQLNFVSSAHLALEPSQLSCVPELLDKIEIENARVILIGKLLRIIELSTGTDITIPAAGDFQGCLWFDRRNTSPVSNL